MALIANAPRLLVVGRDPLLRKLRAEVLKTRGYSVFPATDYADALSRGKPGAYDAVLVSGEKKRARSIGFLRRGAKSESSQIVIVMARPHVYNPGDSCPNDVVENSHPSELLASLEAALA